MKNVVELEAFIMRLLTIFVMLVFLQIASGCSDKLNEIKEAALEIDATAEKAAKAISLDAHTIRAVELDHNNKTFTINDLFITILRDVQWEYDEIDTIQSLKVNGKWQESLFEGYINSEIQKSGLDENGNVTIELEFINGQINPESTSFSMTLNNKTIVEENGEKAYIYLLDYYTSL